MGRRRREEETGGQIPREGNTDAGRVDERDRYGERSATGRSSDYGDERGEGRTRTNDRDTSRVGRRDRENGGYERAEDRGTSWASVVLGWLTALGAGLILSGIVGAIVGGILAAVGVGAGTAGLIGLLATLFLAFLIGGYAAGRMASRSGVKHGLFVPLLSLLVIIALAIIGAIVGANFLDQLGGVALPALPPQAEQAVPQQNLGTILTVSGILALVVPFIGGALGGAWGAARGRNRP